MEDISRELEREIARAKPAPYKIRKKKRILIIDDFGELSSGWYLKFLIYFFLIISILGALGTAGFNFLYAKAQRENIDLKGQVARSKEKVEGLTKDKEILMARLVMAGKKPDLAPPVQKVVEQDGIIPKPLIEKNEVELKEKSVLPISEPKAAVVLPETLLDDLTVPVPPPNPMVSVEKFTVVQGKAREKLIIKFNIRNISTEAKEISGRIFAVLRPETSRESDWVVVPKGIIKNSIPGPYENGKYFSISRFKPVKFTTKNQASPDIFKTATVYIFGEEGELLFENTIQINGAE